MSQTSRVTKVSIARFFKALPDPRPHRGKITHPLLTIVVIALCATIAGAENYEMIHQFAKTRFDWLAKLVDLSQGIPSHDTFERVFAHLDPIAFQQCLLKWVAALQDATKGKLIAIDGKAVREAMNRSKDQGPLTLVSAWASANQMFLGQVAGPEGSSELGALPELLQILDLEGAIVTLDALGCQKEIVQQIVDKKGDYVISVKGNQENLQEMVVDTIEKALNSDEIPATKTHTTIDQGHGRVEERTITVVDAPEDFEGKAEWKGIKSFVMVSRTTTTSDGQSKVGIRYFISSLKASARKFLEVVRNHWTIENQLHWQLDVSFREDLSRARQKHSQANLGVLRRVGLSMIKNTPGLKGSIHSKRQQAAWSEKTLEAILLGAKI